MVQAADLWEATTLPAQGGCTDRSLGQSLLREMRAASVVVLRAHAQVMLIEDDDDMVETFVADRGDDAFDMGVLARQSWRGGDLLDGHRPHTIVEGRP